MGSQTLNIKYDSQFLEVILSNNLAQNQECLVLVS